MSPVNLDPKEEALRRAQEKIKENSSSASIEEVPISPETDPGLQDKFPDAPKPTEPESADELAADPEPTSEPLPAPPLDAKLSFSCSNHGPQPLKEIRYTTIILACGCEWIYDCGHLCNSRRGPK